MAKLAFPIRAVLFIVQLGKPSAQKPLQKQRRLIYLFMRLMNRLAGIRTPGFYKVSDEAFVATEGHRIALKIYTPVKTDKPLPVWLYFHGGGFAWGHYHARSNFTRAIAVKANCIVVSVQYRLAPENPFPAGVNDCYEATKWVAANAHRFGGDGASIAVGGESAGGNLAAVVSMMARDKNGPKILHQTLMYPVVETAMNRPSINKYATGYMLTKELMQQFHQAYLQREEDRLNPYASPMYGNLYNLPPALVITAEYDPLVDEGNAYADKLKENGVPVVHRFYPGMIHDFTIAFGTWLPEAINCTNLVAEEVNKALYAATIVK